MMENGNCAQCLNEMLGVLRASEVVERVESNFTAGCLAIDHDNGLDALVALIATSGRAIEVASNGERMMVPVSFHQESGCRVPVHTVRVSLDGRVRTPVTPGDARGDSRGLTADPTSGDSLLSGLCPICRSDPTRDSGRGCVQVLWREPYIPGLAKRMVRWFVRRSREPGLSSSAF